MVQRLTYRRRHAWRNASNKIRKVKTPGGKLALLYRVKSSSKPRCGDCHANLQGIPCRRPKELRTLRRHERTVSRAYGGSRCATCVRSRIVRAFLIEEQKIVKAVLKQRGGKKAAAVAQ